MKTRMVEYKTGTVCVRCGMEKKEAKVKQFECYVGWGNTDPKHIWNTETVKIKTHFITL